MAAPRLNPQDRVDALRRIDGLTNPVQLDQLCGRCQNRGYIQDPHSGRSENCACQEGRFLTYREVALNTLTLMWGAREAQRWLEDRNPRTRQRRTYMLREGDEAAAQVFEEIRRETVIKGVAPPVLPTYDAPTAPRRPAETLQDTSKERMVADFRRAGRHDAAELYAANQIEDMEDEDRAFLDAMITGTGYLVDGKWASPDRVKVLRWGRLTK